MPGDKPYESPEVGGSSGELETGAFHIGDLAGGKKHVCSIYTTGLGKSFYKSEANDTVPDEAPKIGSPRRVNKETTG